MPSIADIDFTTPTLGLVSSERAQKLNYKNPHHPQETVDYGTVHIFQEVVMYSLMDVQWRIPLPTWQDMCLLY